MSDPLSAYRRDGWAMFPPDPALTQWAEACAPLAREMMADPARAGEYRCAGTWFAGVNALANDASGAVPGRVPPLAGEAVEFTRTRLGLAAFGWDRAQVSGILPGYPRHGEEDTEASYRYRRNRCAAHVDGLERVMPSRRRHLSETHSFLLGIPLGDAGEEEGAFVVWRGSHAVMRAAFVEALAPHDPARWFEVDITDAYVAARKQCLDICEPVRIAPGLGAAYVMHPLALHGVAPWEAEAGPPRIVAYFRPDAFGGDPVAWLNA